MDRRWPGLAAGPSVLSGRVKMAEIDGGRQADAEIRGRTFRHPADAWCRAITDNAEARREAAWSVPQCCSRTTASCRSQPQISARLP
jgi:hypothetical protein